MSRSRRTSFSLRGVAPLGAALALLVAACNAGPTTPPVPGSTELLTVSPASASPAATAAPSPEETVEPTPAEPAPTAVEGACRIGDLKASHGLVEGAAGSRLSQVVLVSAADCSIDLYPTFAIRDSTGALLVGSVPGGPGRIDLAAGTAYVSDARLGNWCIAEPAYPAELVLVLLDGTLAVTGSSFPAEGDPPPCTADGPPLLDGTAWAPAP